MDERTTVFAGSSDSGAGETAIHPHAADYSIEEIRSTTSAQLIIVKEVHESRRMACGESTIATQTRDGIPHVADLPLEIVNLRLLLLQFAACLQSWSDACVICWQSQSPVCQ